MENRKWEIIHQLKDQGYSVNDIVAVLLQNRGIETKEAIEEFFHPTHPKELSLLELGIDEKQVNKAVSRVRLAKDSNEKVIVFGDYDADGVCATAVLWEALFEREIDALPYIPDRFSEGYGLKGQAIIELKEKYPNLGLIITVDNGIVAFDGVAQAKKLGIDVIITDHHQVAEPIKAHAIVHTTLTSGSAISWVFARELSEKIEKIRSAEKIDITLNEGLALVAIGTISDQLPLVGINRSFVKHGLEVLRNTRNVGLQALAREANIMHQNIGVYEVGFVIAPRINAAGRLAHAIDSLRLLCTRDGLKATSLSQQLSRANLDRQQMVETMVRKADQLADGDASKGFLVIVSEEFHEGIIGLAASKLVEKFSRPAIVISKGKDVSRASARSLPGIDIIAEIRKLKDYLVEVGGHQMAAGFSIENTKIDDFLEKLEENTKGILTEEIKQKKVRVDEEVPLSSLSWELAEKLTEFEPVGTGNPAAVFATQVNVIDCKQIGSDKRHLKLKVSDDASTMDAIAFSFGPFLDEIRGQKVNLAYNLDINHYNGSQTLQMKIKDIKIRHGDGIS